MGLLGRFRELKSFFNWMFIVLASSYRLLKAGEGESCTVLEIEQISEKSTGGRAVS